MQLKHRQKGRITATPVDENLHPNGKSLAFTTGNDPGGPPSDLP